MPNMTITTEEFEALLAERDSLRGELNGLCGERDGLRGQCDGLVGEVRVLKAQCDLLQEKLKAYQRKLFMAKSEARGTDQRDMFFNEAESLAPTPDTSPAQEDDAEESVEVAGHQRKKRGRKPLDPALPREIIRHELPESERHCPHDGAALVEIGVETSEQLWPPAPTCRNSAGLKLLRGRAGGDGMWRHC